MPLPLIDANVTGNAATATTATTVTTNANLTGEVTSVGNVATVPNATVIAKVLTGFTSGAGTVSATDSILAAIQKVVGNIAAKLGLAGGTMTGALALAAGVPITLVLPTADATNTAFALSGILAGETITKGDVVYLETADGRWWKAKANAQATSIGSLAVAMADGTAGNALLVALPGSLIFMTSYAWTVGAPLYLSSATGGAMSESIPSGAADLVVRPMGTSYSADVFHFNPSPDFSTTVA